MKTHTYIKVIVLLATVYLSNTNVLAQATVTDSAYAYYNRGYDAFRTGNFFDAQYYFGRSFGYKPVAVTAYMMAYCFLNTRNLDYAKLYISKSLELQPALQEPYLADARKVRDYCQNRDVERDKYYEIESKADDGARRPETPTIPVPPINIPSKNNIPGELKPVDKRKAIKLITVEHKYVYHITSKSKSKKKVNIDKTGIRHKSIKNP